MDERRHNVVLASVERGELFELIRRQRDDVMRLQLQREQLDEREPAVRHEMPAPRRSQPAAW